MSDEIIAGVGTEVKLADDDLPVMAVGADPTDPALPETLAIQPVSVRYRAPKGRDPRFYGWWADMSFGAHLMQVLALAHFHGTIMRRAVMSAANLHRLSLCQGLIPELLWKAKPHSLEADHEFWGHFSGDSSWLVQLRQDTEASLLKEGLHDVVASINHDRQRFARPQRNATERTCYRGKVVRGAAFVASHTKVGKCVTYKGTPYVGFRFDMKW